MYDLLIKNGTVVDGTGAPRFQADVAVKDGKIARIAPEIAEGAETVIDARGLVVAPGFIDTHTHSDGTVFSPETTGYNHLEDGATTELAGQCGSMAAPYYGEFDPSHGISREEYERICESYTSYFAYVDSIPHGANLAFFAGQGPIRGKVMGFGDGTPDEEQLEQMRGLMREAMECGCLGFSTGLVYTPSVFAGTHELVEIAKAEGADAIAHGCTGKGNDQVRFELAIKRFAPDMPIIAPWREWDIKGRDEEIDYAEAHNVPLKISRETNYSKDKNLWHLSHEGLDLEDPANEPQYEKEGFLELGVSPIQAPDKPTYVTIHFEKGIPTAIDGKEMGAVELVEKLNELGGANGIGLADLVENRLVGMKSRGVYETPGGTILYHAHDVLETITLDKETARTKQYLSIKFADIVYNGQWYTPLREALTAFVNETQKTVTGDVKLKLYKGNIINAGVTSPYTLYDEEVATFDAEDVYNQKDAEGFINLFGLPIHVKAVLDQKRNNK